jgi:hypothetical protein
MGKKITIKKIDIKMNDGNSIYFPKWEREMFK